jgi:urea transport system permease protein
MLTLAAVCLMAGGGFCASALAQGDIPPALKDAVRKLGTADDDERQKIYAQLAEDGDSRLIPALKAFVDGRLQDRSGTLIIWGDHVVLPDKGDAFPILDAFTQQPLKNGDGTDLYEYRKRIDLSAPGMMRLPPAKRAERGQIADLTQTLSLLDPDPVARLASIRSVGERAMGAFSTDADIQSKAKDDLPKYVKALRIQASREKNPTFLNAINEALASLDAALGDHSERMSAIASLGSFGTSRAANILEKVRDGAIARNDTEMANSASAELSRAHRRQNELEVVQDTFFGLSLGSILVLLALGLSIIFGLMGVINMAHGEFMMIGAFTTFVVSEFFKAHLPGWFDWYPIVAIPAAFLVAGVAGYICEALIIRHLYGRPLETLLATWGVSLILIQAARQEFGNTLSVTPPHWMEGGFEVVPDLVFPLNRLYIILFCAFCIGGMYFIVNFTKLGLLLRATTQNRQMAQSLGVPTRRIDGLTFAIGCGLAGLAGVAVPLYNKINPDIGQEYIVDSFMVVVVGGVGTLGGAVIAGLALGFINKYLEPILEHVPALASGASVIGKVIVLGMIIAFLQRKPSGLFPPKGRMADG